MKRIYLILLLLLSLAFIGFAQEGRSSPLNKGIGIHPLLLNSYSFNGCDEAIGNPSNISIDNYGFGALPYILQ